MMRWTLRATQTTSGILASCCKDLRKLQGGSGSGERRKARGKLGPKQVLFPSSAVAPPVSPMSGSQRLCPLALTGHRS